MSMNQLPQDQYAKAFGTGDTLVMGSLKMPNHGELGAISVKLWIWGTPAKTERIRLKIYSDSGYDSNSLLYTSEWANVSSIPNIGSLASPDSLAVLLPVEFNRENVNKELTYYVKCEIDSYTRNGDTFWIGLLYDWPLPFYDNSQDLFYNHPLAMLPFVYEDAA